MITVPEPVLTPPVQTFDLTFLFLSSILRGYFDYNHNTLVSVPNMNPNSGSHNITRPSLWYSYGTPITRFLIFSIGTTISLHLLWERLYYKELLQDSDIKIKQLEQTLQMEIQRRKDAEMGSTSPDSKNERKFWWKPW